MYKEIEKIQDSICAIGFITRTNWIVISICLNKQIFQIEELKLCNKSYFLGGGTFTPTENKTVF